MDISPKQPVDVEIFSNESTSYTFFKEEKDTLIDLARIKNISINEKEKDRPKKSAMLATSHSEIFIKLDGVIDIQGQIDRLERDLKKQTATGSNLIKNYPIKIFLKMLRPMQLMKQKKNLQKPIQK